MSVVTTSKPQYGTQSAAVGGTTISNEHHDEAVDVDSADETSLESTDPSLGSKTRTSLLSA